MARPPGWHHDLSPAARWVLAHGLATRVRPPTGVLDEESWRRLRSESFTHKLDGLLVDAVATDALPVTPAQADEVAELEIDLTQARMWQEQRLVEVVELIEGGGVEVRVLKGLAVATLDYPDPQMRPTGDVDLLVRGTDLDRAAQLVEDTGGDLDRSRSAARLLGPGGQGGDAGHRCRRDRPAPPPGVGTAGGAPRPRPALVAQPAVHGRRSNAAHPDPSTTPCCMPARICWCSAPVGRWSCGTWPSWPPDADLDVEGLLVRARQWRAEALLATAVLLSAEELGLGTLAQDELGRWAAGYPVTLRDRLWLRIERPQEPVPGLEAVATLIELPSRQARWELIRATLRPAPGTWAGPGRRARSLGRKLVRTSLITESLTNRSARTDLVGRSPHR